MRLKNLSLTILAIGLFACQNKPNYTIEGTLPDNRFDGQQMYLVPFTGARPENVDSCTIRNGLFRFEGKTDSSSLHIIRPAIFLREHLQEALVFVEEGTIEARIDSSSSVTGTRNNNLLQSWKAAKEKLDRQLYAFGMARMKADSLGRIALTAKIDSVEQATAQFNYCFVRENKGTATARFIGSLFKNSLTPEQQTELELNEPSRP